MIRRSIDVKKNMAISISSCIGHLVIHCNESNKLDDNKSCQNEYLGNYDLFSQILKPKLAIYFSDIKSHNQIIMRSVKRFYRGKDVVIYTLIQNGTRVRVILLLNI